MADPPRTKPKVRLDLGPGDGVATLVLDHPPLNILDLEVLEALDVACDRIAEESSRVVVIKGAGKAFCAGVDIAIHTRERIPEMLGAFHGVLRKWWNLEGLTIAAVHGHCLGGGLELAACSDLVVAESDARFALPEIRVGCFPPVAAALFPALLGPGLALDLMTTGRTLTGEEAERHGLVQRLAPPGQLAGVAAEFVLEIIQWSAVAQRLAKKAVRAGLGDDFEQALEAAERIYLEEMAATHDVEEGAQAFLEKRPPRWQHR
jgi:cyclohexa-1,5-dienecarbonyl-CoA hydratase